MDRLQIMIVSEPASPENDQLSVTFQHGGATMTLGMRAPGLQRREDETPGAKVEYLLDALAELRRAVEEQKQ